MAAADETISANSVGMLAPTLLVGLLVAVSGTETLEFREETVTDYTRYEYIGAHLDAEQQEETGFKDLVERDDLTKAEIEQSLAKWALVQGGTWPQIQRGLSAHLETHLEQEETKIEKFKYSSGAKAFLKEQLTITFNKNLNWMDDCRRKNELILKQKPAIIEELKLFVNTRCLHDKEVETVKRAHSSGKKIPQFTGYRSKPYNYYVRYFSTLTDGVQGADHDEVMKIITEKKTTTVTEIKTQLEGWCKKKGHSDLFEKFVSWHKGMYDRKKKARAALKISEGARKLKLKELEIHYDEKLSLVDNCHKKNQLILDAGPELAKEAGLALDSWCFGSSAVRTRHVERAFRKPSRTTSLIVHKQFNNIIQKQLHDSYLVGFTSGLGHDQLQRIRPILQNNTLTKQQITIQITQIIEKHGDDKSKEQLEKALAEEKELRAKQEADAKKLKVSEDARKLLLEVVAIAANQKITLWDQCKQKNALLIKVGEAAANEAGLAINTWCLHDPPPPPPTPQPVTIKKTVVEVRRYTTVDEEEVYYGPFLARLSDKQRSEVEVFVKGGDLARESVLEKIQKWTEKQTVTEKKYYTELTESIKTKTVEMKSRFEKMKLSDDAKVFASKVTEFESDHTLTQRESCRKVNELILIHGEKVAAEVGVSANLWCSFSKAKVANPPAPKCHCHVHVEVEADSDSQ